MTAGSTATTVAPDGRRRCGWISVDDPIALRYHDDVWGTPTKDPRAVFEALTLGVFETGLNWLLVLHRRDALAAAFADFEPARIAEYTAADLQRLLKDPSIIRNRRKINATITNARLAARDPAQLVNSLWHEHQPFTTAAAPRTQADVPTLSPAGDEAAHRLHTAGYEFIGPVGAQSLLQSIGVINAHLAGCFLSLEPG